MFFLPLLAGAALGAAKHTMDAGRANKQRKLAAETQRLSPWTGMEAQAVNEPSLFGSLLSGGMTGLSMGQNMEAMDAWRDGLLKASAAPAGSIAASGAEILPGLGAAGGFTPGGGSPIDWQKLLGGSFNVAGR
jgi:hypothetical protein